MNPINKLWRESATLILIARNPIIKSLFDYRVLLLQRSSKSRFMPNRHVFPGGVVEQCDFADEWMDLYQHFFQTLGLDFSNLLNMRGPRPPIFRKSQTKVPSEIAFRICAIRETFEESGILLLKNISEQSQARLSVGCCEVNENLPKNEIQKWRKKVYNDASQFINMCRELQCVPDVWSLGEWSNWLTPVDMKIRFDTAFYICFVDHEPLAQHDNMETVQSQWKTPIEAIQDRMRKKSILGPPQALTLMQFCRFTSWKEMKSFQDLRAPEGCDRWLTVRVKCSDGELILLAGDDLYPVVYDHVVQMTRGELGILNGIVPMQEFSETLEELRSKAKNLNRFEQPNNSSPTVIRNCTPTRGLCAPLTDPTKLLLLAQKEEHSKL